jgi:hypothetical protein
MNTVAVIEPNHNPEGDGTAAVRYASEFELWNLHLDGPLCRQSALWRQTCDINHRVEMRNH